MPYNMSIYIVKCTYISEDEPFSSSELSSTELIDRIFERAIQLKNKKIILSEHVISSKKRKIISSKDVEPLKKTTLSNKYTKIDEWRVDMCAANPHVTYIPYSRQLHGLNSK